MMGSLLKYLMVTVTVFMSAAVTFSRDYDVYLLIGQSNMAGRGEILPEDRQPLEGVWLLDDNGDVVPACAPLNLYSSIRKKADMQGFGLGASFAESLHEQSGRDILLIVNARGGSSLEQWMKGAESGAFSESEWDEDSWCGRQMPSFFEDAVRRCRQAMAYGDLKAVIWHQGESNSSPEKAAVYLDSLSVFVEDLRNALDAAVPFIAGEVFHGFSGAGKFNPEISRIAEVIPNSACVSAEGCGSNPDKVHFSRDGLILLGRRYAAAVLERKN